jgi:branched-chain amino acid transport system permease protein
MTVSESQTEQPLDDSPAAAPGIAERAGQRAAPSTRRRPLWSLPALLLAVAPFFLGPADLDVLTRILSYGLLAASLSLLIGFLRLPSLGQAAPFGIGAYTAGLMAIHVTPFAPLLMVGGAAAAAVGSALVGWLLVRTSGIYFLMLTLAVGEIVFELAETSRGVTGGSNGLYGIPAPELSGPVTGAAPIYWLVLAGATVGFAALWAVARSPFGLALRGVGDNEERMRSLGYRTRRHKLAGWCISGAVAGLGGALLAMHQQLVVPGYAGLSTSIAALVAVVVGGAGSLWGACIGAGIVIVLRDEIGSSLGGHGPLLLGAIFILVVYVAPGGLAGLLARLVAWRRA